MNLLTLRLGSRDRIHPESPLLQRIACYIRRFRRYSLMFSRDIVPVAFAIPYHWSIPMDKYLHPSFLHYTQSILLLQDTSKFSLVFREYFVTIALQFFVTWIPLWIFFALTEYPFIPNCLCVSQNSSKYYPIFQKSSVAYGSWNACLPALWLIPND